MSEGARKRKRSVEETGEAANELAGFMASIQPDSQPAAYDDEASGDEEEEEEEHSSSGNGRVVVEEEEEEEEEEDVLDDEEEEDDDDDGLDEEEREVRDRDLAREHVEDTSAQVRSSYGALELSTPRRGKFKNVGSAVPMEQDDVDEEIAAQATEKVAAAVKKGIPASVSSSDDDADRNGDDDDVDDDDDDDDDNDDDDDDDENGGGEGGKGGKKESGGGAKAQQHRRPPSTTAIHESTLKDDADEDERSGSVDPSAAPESLISELREIESEFESLKTKLFAGRLASLDAEIATVESGNEAVFRGELGKMEAAQVARVERADRLRRYRVSIANVAFEAARKAAADECAEKVRCAKERILNLLAERERRLEEEVESLGLMIASRAQQLGPGGSEAERAAARAAIEAKLNEPIVPPAPSSRKSRKRGDPTYDDYAGGRLASQRRLPVVQFALSESDLRSDLVAFATAAGDSAR